jgi:hypothetical protein
VVDLEREVDHGDLEPARADHQVWAMSTKRE